MKGFETSGASFAGAAFTCAIEGLDVQNGDEPHRYRTKLGERVEKPLPKMGEKCLESWTLDKLFRDGVMRICELDLEDARKLGAIADQPTWEFFEACNSRVVRMEEISVLVALKLGGASS